MCSFISQNDICVNSLSKKWVYDDVDPYVELLAGLVAKYFAK
jgi:hypothetical protein